MPITNWKSDCDSFFTQIPTMSIYQISEQTKSLYKWPCLYDWTGSLMFASECCFDSRWSASLSGKCHPERNCSPLCLADYFCCLSELPTFCPSMLEATSLVRYLSQNEVNFCRKSWFLLMVEPMFWFWS